MARISVVGTPFTSFLLQDLDKKQSLREHTINPPGEEQYLNPVDNVALTAALVALGGTAVDAELAAFLAGTVGAADDISLATIITQADLMTNISGTTTGEAQVLQDLMSVLFTETGNFLLSFKDGVIAGALTQGWIKVFTSAGGALFTL